MHHKHSFGEYSKTDIICKRGSSVRNTAWYCRELQFAIREKTTQSTVNGSQAAWVNFSADSGAAPISPAVFSTCHKIEVTFPLPQLPMQSRWRNSNTFKHNPEWPLLRRVHYTGIQYSRATLQWCIGMLQNYSTVTSWERRTAVTNMQSRLLQAVPYEPEQASQRSPPLQPLPPAIEDATVHLQYITLQHTFEYMVDGATQPNSQWHLV